MDGKVGNFDKLRYIVHTLKSQGVITSSHNKKDGYYRLVQHADEEVMWWEGPDIDDSKVNLWLPFGLSKAVYISRPGLVVVAGDTNAGKTAFLLNTLYLSTLKEKNFRNNALLLMTEGLDLLKGRMNKLYKGIVPTPPPFRTFRKLNNFEDDVLPDGLTVIDYLRPPSSESLMSVGDKLTAIYSKLNTGIVVVAMQKPKGERGEAFGGIITQWDANLALSIHSNWGGKPYVKLNKIKKPLILDKDLSALKISFRIEQGIIFTEEEKVYE